MNQGPGSHRDRANNHSFQAAEDLSNGPLGRAVQLGAIAETGIDQVENGARGAFGAGSALEQLEEEELVQQLRGIVSMLKCIGSSNTSISGIPSLVETYASLNLAQAAVSLPTIEITGRALLRFWEAWLSSAGSNSRVSRAVLSQLIWILVSCDVDWFMV
jgi:hypothetical protein